jgi:hypothetical protein
VQVNEMDMQERRQKLLNLKSFEAMRMRETFQQIYQAPDMQTFKTLLHVVKLDIYGIIGV